MISRKSTSYLILAFLILSSVSSLGATKLKFVATVPEVSWLIKQMTLGEADVVTLSSGKEDLHFLEARIDYIIQIRKADIVCFTGLGLEEGWLPKVLQRSGNLKVQRGQKGFCNLGQNIKALGVLKGSVDRSMGHVHLAGNPHYSNSPLYMIQALEQLTRVLIRNQPNLEKQWLSRQVKVEQKLNNIFKRVKQELSKLLRKKNKINIVSYHSEFDYFLKSYGFGNIGMIEDKPGLAPSGRRILQVSKKAKVNNVKLAFYTDFNSQSVMSKFSAITKIPIVKLAAHALSDDEESYLEWQMTMAQKVLDAVSL